MKTLSGGSLGSLEQLHMDWNAADTSEVSSRTPAGQISDHPAGPSSVAQKLFAVKAALQEAEQTTMVSAAEQELTALHFVLIFHYPQSPRFGLSNRNSTE